MIYYSLLQLNQNQVCDSVAIPIHTFTFKRSVNRATGKDINIKTYKMLALYLIFMFTPDSSSLTPSPPERKGGGSWSAGASTVPPSGESTSLERWKGHRVWREHARQKPVCHSISHSPKQKQTNKQKNHYHHSDWKVHAINTFMLKHC